MGAPLVVVWLLRVVSVVPAPWRLNASTLNASTIAAWFPACYHENRVCRSLEEGMLIRLLKHTWFFRGFDKLRNLVVATLARIETRQANDTAVLTRIEHRLAALDSLSANHAAIRDGLLHLLQRA